MYNHCLVNSSLQYFNHQSYLNQCFLLLINSKSFFPIVYYLVYQNLSSDPFGYYWLFSRKGEICFPNSFPFISQVTLQKTRLFLPKKVSYFFFYLIPLPFFLLVPFPVTLEVPSALDLPRRFQG